MAWLQSGSAILVLVSMQIPHSCSRSRSSSDMLPRSSSTFFLYRSWQTAFCFISSISVIPPCSCCNDGYMYAATPHTDEGCYYSFHLSGKNDSWGMEEKQTTICYIWRSVVHSTPALPGLFPYNANSSKIIVINQIVMQAEMSRLSSTILHIHLVLEGNLEIWKYYGQESKLGCLRVVRITIKLTKTGFPFMCWHRSGPIKIHLNPTHCWEQQSTTYTTIALLTKCS